MNGKLEPEHWDDPLAFLRDRGWRFVAVRYEGEKLVDRVDPA
jgi:hypothetical protein